VGVTVDVLAAMDGQNEKYTCVMNYEKLGVNNNIMATYPLSSKQRDT
jgi:hypothetical protein